MADLKNKKQHANRIAIDGELTIFTATELKAKLLMELWMSDKLDVDLSCVDEIDAAGLQLLVMVKREATALGKVLRLTGHSPVVVDLLDLSGLAGFFGDPLLIIRKPAHEGKST